MILEEPSRQVGEVDESSAPTKLYHLHKQCKTGSKIEPKEPLSKVGKKKKIAKLALCCYCAAHSMH